MPDDIRIKYWKSVSNMDENLFQKYLSGYIGSNYEFASHLKNIKQIKGLIQKMKYLLVVKFPDKQFMIQAYQINYQRLFWFYYPYSHCIGLKALTKMLVHK